MFYVRKIRRALIVLHLFRVHYRDWKWDGKCERRWCMEESNQILYSRHCSSSWRSLSFSSDTFEKKSFSSGTKKTNLTATSHMSSSFDGRRIEEACSSRSKFLSTMLRIRYSSSKHSSLEQWENIKTLGFLVFYCIYGFSFDCIWWPGSTALGPVASLAVCWSGW